MNRKRCALWLCAGVLIICAALLILSDFRSSTDSRFTQKVESDSFSLGMELLNDTLEETFYLQTGDTIDVDVVHISGELCISFGQKNHYIFTKTFCFSGVFPQYETTYHTVHKMQIISKWAG